MPRVARDMPQVVENSNQVQMRSYLRDATAHQHDLLDNSIHDDIFASEAAYADFLSRQLAARLPIEIWTARSCPRNFAPPPVAPLIIEDLQALGRPFSLPGLTFDLPARAHPIGLAWAVAGSHLGNRAMLHRLRQSGYLLPAAFLSDQRGAEFWARLKPQLEAEWPKLIAEAALTGARAVFEHFLLAFEGDSGKKLAA